MHVRCDDSAACASPFGSRRADASHHCRQLMAGACKAIQLGVVTMGQYPSHSRQDAAGKGCTRDNDGLVVGVVTAGGGGRRRVVPGISAIRGRRDAARRGQSVVKGAVVVGAHVEVAVHAVADLELRKWCRQGAIQSALCQLLMPVKGCVRMLCSCFQPRTWQRQQS